MTKLLAYTETRCVTTGLGKGSAMKSLIIIAVGGLCLSALAFPKASEAEAAEFRRLYRECLEDNCTKKTLLRGRGGASYPSEAYNKLRGFGPEICELLYQESCKGEVARAVRADNKYSPMAVGLENERILGNLWCMHTLQFSSKYTDVDFLWTGEPISFQWEGGDLIASERASFLVQEMRIAKRENRRIDARRAAGNLQIMGVFAFPTLFGELINGHDDVVEILVAEEWICHDVPVFNKAGLLEWWAKNSKRYELPRQSANFKGSAQLGKWRRIEAEDRKIRVFDARDGVSPLAVETNLSSRLTCADLRVCFDSITLMGTNLHLKCANSGARFRCIFNDILYGSRSNEYGEVLMLPEGSSLVMTNGEIEFTFLPIVSSTLGKSGFYARLKRNDADHGEELKNGFLLFAPSVGSVGIADAAPAIGNDIGCTLKGIALRYSLADD